MIIGVGVDQTRLSRFVALHRRFPLRFAQRILHPLELSRFHAAANPPRMLAHCFAVKEAAAKALGRGFRGVAPSDFALQPDSLGRPTLVMSDRAKALCPAATLATHVSLTDEGDYVTAFVVLESCVD